MSYELPEPHSAHTLSLADTHLLLRCDETITSSSLVDAAGGSPLVQVGSPGVAGSLFASPAGTSGARTFNGSSQHASRAGTTADRTVAIGANITVEAWIRPDALGGTRTIIAYGGAGETLGTNTAIALQLAGTELRASWEYGSGVDVSLTSSGAGLVAGRVYHVAVVRSSPASRTAGKCDVRLYLDGRDIAGAADLDMPSGATSASWIVGASPGGASDRYSGALDDIRVSKFAASPEGIRASYARGVLDYDLATLYATGLYDVHHRALVYDDDGDRWIDLSDLYGWDWIESVEWSDSTDDQGASASIVLRRNVYDVSTAPGISSSPLNLDTATGATLLRLVARVRIEVAPVPLGTSKAGALWWHVAFDGHITAIDPTGERVKLECFDRITPLQDTWIEPDRSTSPPTDRVYGSTSGTAVEGELQAIIDDNEPSGGYKGGLPSIYVPSSPGWNVYEFVTPPTTNVSQQLEDVVSQIGWLLRYKLDDHRKDWRLTFYEPDRAASWASGDPEIPAWQVLDTTRLELARDDIRNACEVEYGDAATTDNTGTIQRATVLVEDAASIALYGRRYCRIGLASTGELNDLAQSTALGTAVVSDLAWPKADIEREILFRHNLEVGDVVRFGADGLHYDTDQDFAIVAIRHRLTASSRRTTLTCRAAKPVGKVTRWWDIITQRGRIPGKGLTAPAAPIGAALDRIVGGIRVRWDYPTDLARAYLETEVHVGAAGFTPTAATLERVVRGNDAPVLALTPGTTREVKVAHRDRMGNVSAAVSAGSAAPRYLLTIPAARVHRANSNQAIAAAGVHTVQFNAEDYDLGGFFNTSLWRWTCPVAGVARVDAVVKLDFLGKPGQRARVVVRDYTNLNVKGCGPWVDPQAAGGAGGDEVYATFSGDIEVTGAGVQLEVRVEVSEACEVAYSSLSGEAVSWATFRLVSED